MTYDTEEERNKKDIFFNNHCFSLKFREEGKAGWSDWVSDQSYGFQL